MKNKRRDKNDDMVTVMIGSGSHAIFVKKKRGERYMLADGTFAIAGDSPEASRARVDKRLDDLVKEELIPKPSFVKRLTNAFKIGRRR